MNVSGHCCEHCTFVFEFVKNEFHRAFGGIFVVNDSQCLLRITSTRIVAKFGQCYFLILLNLPVLNMVALLCKVVVRARRYKHQRSHDLTHLLHAARGLPYVLCFFLQPVYDKRKVIAILPYTQIPDTDELR